MDKEALERRLASIFEEAEEAGIHLDGKPERVPVSRGDRPPSRCRSGVKTVARGLSGPVGREMRVTGAPSPHSTSMVPRWRATTRRTTDSPSPAPAPAAGMFWSESC